jgi:hypothetical protein
MTMKRGLFLSSALMLITLAVSCTSIPAIQVSDTSAILPSATATRKPSPTFKPTHTITPTWTPEPTLTPMPTELAGLLEKYDCFPFNFESHTKEWRFYYQCHAPPIGYGQSAVLLNLRTGESWYYPYCKFYNQCLNEDYPSEGYLWPIAWSSDEKYLYVEMTGGGDGGTQFHYVSKLISINLDNGFASVFLDSVAVYEFSPGAKKLAYIPIEWEVSGDDWNRIEPYFVFVRDLEYEAEFKLLLEPGYDDAGDIVWSPDGSQFVFLAVQYDNANNIERSTLMLVDVYRKSRAILIDNYPASINSINWQSDGMLELLDAYGKPAIYYDVNNKIMIVIPSPTPTITKTYKEPKYP